MGPGINVRTTEKGALIFFPMPLDTGRIRSVSGLGTEQTFIESKGQEARK